MIKKYIIIIIIGLILCALAIAFYLNNQKVDYSSYEPFGNKKSYFETYSFPKINTNIPTIEVSIAAYPFSAKLVEAIADKNAYKDELKHISTQQSYQDVIDNKVDISISFDTSDEQNNIIEESEDIVRVPFAKEALVFYTNANNPVDSLTIDEINKIYNLEITNWNILGGKDLEILPFQLEKNVGGSEKCFSKIVSENKSSKIENLIACDMKNIVDLTSRNEGGIGYAFNQFYSKLYLKNSLKKLKVNEIEPTDENIANGSYPLLFNVYYIYRKSNDNENVQKIIDWLLSDEGQNFIAKNGYCPIK